MEEVTNNNQSVEEGSFELKKLSKSRDSNARSRISLLSKEYLFKHNIRDIRSKRVNLSPLHEAINRGDMKAVKQMMETVKRRYLNTVDAHGMTCLHYASKHGHTDIALLLLDNGASINFTTRQGGALQTAIRYRKEETAAMLLSRGASAALIDVDGMNALHLAVNNRLTVIAKILLEKYMLDVNAQDSKMNSALHYSAINDDVATCRALLDHGASIDIKNSSGETALHLATGEGSNGVIDALLNIDFDEHAFTKEQFINMERDDSRTALLLAAQLGEFEIMKTLISHGANIHSIASGKRSALHLAASSGNESAVNMLLEKGVCINLEDDDGRVPLHDAVMAGRDNIVKLLLSKNACVDSKDRFGTTPLLITAQSNNITVAKWLLQHGADSSNQDDYLKTALHYALENGSTEFAIALVERRKSLIHAKDEDNQTPLHYAAKMGYSKILEIFIGRTTKIDDIDSAGETALHLASRYGNTRCVDLLIKNARLEDLNHYNLDDRTPLHLAVIGNHPSVCLALLCGNADVNRVDRTGWTPLFYAVSHDDISVLEILLQNDADVNACDKWGNTALMVASGNDKVNAVSLLLESGANLQHVNRDGDNFFDIAIDFQRESACKVILESSRWREVLSSKDHNGSHFMQKLIEKHPGLAEIVLDRSTVFSDHHPEDPRLKVSFDFRFLEESPESKSLVSDLVGISTTGKSNLYFGPKIMSKFGREQLTCHPIVSTLISIKKRRLSSYFYYLRFGIFIVFNILLNVLLVKEGRTKNKNSYTNSSATQSYSTSISSMAAYRVIAYITFSIGVLQIAMEVFKLFVLRHKYFYNAENFVEITLYVFAVWHLRIFLFEAIEDPIFIPVICILLAWTNHILYLKGMPMYGIYVTMFIKVCCTVIKLLVLFGVIFLAFILVFYLLQINVDGFKTTVDIIIKVMVMMTGEFEYSEWLVKVSNKELLCIVFLLFVLLVAVAFTNLLIGLAVGDIGSIQSSARMEIIKQDLSLIDNIQRIVPKYLLKKYVNVETYSYAIYKQTRLQRLIKYLTSDTTDADLKKLRMKQTDYDSKPILNDVAKSTMNAITNERLNRLEKLMAKFEKTLQISPS